MKARPHTGDESEKSRVPDPDGRTEGYDYDLPQALIAQEPPRERGDSRLLRLPGSGPRETLRFADLPSLLAAGDLLVLNDTQVIPARIHGHRTATGGKAEVLVVAPVGDDLEILLKTRGTPLAGETLAFHDGVLQLEVREGLGEGRYRVSPTPEVPAFLAALEQLGRVPLPPYIHRDPSGDPHDDEDRHRYQTVFARHPGAVAAPTAGLHFTEELLAETRSLGVSTCTVTLHVGPGTFRPVTCDHHMLETNDTNI